MSKKVPNTVKIAALDLISTSEKRLLAFLESRIVGKRKTFVTTPNPEFLVFARHNPWFRRILNKADVAIPDGVGLIWASKILGQPIRERISGTDLMEKLCQKAAKKKWNLYLVGGQPRTAKETLAVLKKRYPGLKGWAKPGPKLELIKSNWSPKAKKEVKRIVKDINAKEPDLLFVAFGMGKQEKFIWDNWGKLKVKLSMGVGGAFDYISKQVPRAPKWMRQLGLEWLYRLFHQPWRWKRQLRLIEFVWLVLKERFFKQ